MNRANILLTHKCNLNCIHCYLSAGKSVENHEEIYLKTIKLLDKLSKDKIRNVMFTGGECMLFPKIKDLIKYAHEKRMHVTLFTNGMIYDEEIFSMIDSVCLSLDGPEKIHNYIRQNKSSYSNVIKCLDYLKKIDKYTTLQMTLSSINIDYMNFIKEIVLNHLNVRVVKMVFVLDEGRAHDNNLGYNKDDLKKFLSEIDKLYEETIFHIQFKTNYIDEYEFKQYYLTGDIMFPIWFDLVDDKFYMFSNSKKYSDELINYNIKILNSYNKQIIKDLKLIEQKFKKITYLNLEEEIKNICR